VKKSISSAIVGILLLVSVATVSAQGTGDMDGSENISVENDNIAIKVTGNQNVPMFSFWDPADEDTKYDVKFIQLFEVVDEDGNGEYNKDNDTRVAATTEALPSMSWSFSDIENTSDGKTHFNISSEGGPFSVQFLNHLGENASLKFDIKISGYEFSSEDENAMLVLGFHLIADRQGTEVQEQVQAQEQNQNQIQNESKQVNFGENAHFSSQVAAQAQNGNVSVGVTAGESQGNQMAYIAYERFEGELIHDPEIGLGGGVEGGLAIPGYPMLAIGIVVAAAAAIFMKKAKHR